MTTALPPKNHNQPPDELEYLRDNLELRHIALLQEADAHVQLSLKMPETFESDVDANFTTDFIKKIKVCQSALEKERKKEKEPFLRQGKFVDAFFGSLDITLERVIDKANIPLRAYLLKKAIAEAAIRAEEARTMEAEKQRAFEVVQTMPRNSQGAEETTKAIDHLVTMQGVSDIANKSAAMPVTSMAAATGNFARAALVKKWVGTVLDINMLDLHTLRPYFKPSEFQDAVDRFVKQGGRTLEGARIEEIIDTSVK